jgi:SAM-dependent methyltransferase
VRVSSHLSDDLAMTTAQGWDAAAAAFAAAANLRFDHVRYGTDGPSEADVRLLGEVRGKRILDLGCGLGQASIALEHRGAHALALDHSAGMLRQARGLAAEQEVTVEWHESDLADLAFLRAESVDAALCIDALPEVEDADRLFRQVHRVLKPGAPFVCSYEHPMHAVLGRDTPTSEGGLPLGRVVVERSYFDPSPVTVRRHEAEIIVWPRTLAEVFASLHRAGYRVDQLLEPEPFDRGGDPAVPATVVWRARKEGS